MVRPTSRKYRLGRSERSGKWRLSPAGRMLSGLSIWRHALLTLAAALAVSAVTAPNAEACSCVSEPITAETFREHDAAVIARLIEVEAIEDPIYEVAITYRIRRVFTGRKRVDRGDEIVLEDDTNSSCQLPRRVGARDGLFLDHDRDGWFTSLCTMTTPRTMRIAAQRTGFARLRACGP